MTDKADKAPSKERRYKGASKLERQTERHEQLIAAGIAVIGSEGYQATKVKQVCQQAGLTERYFYESFANKEALLCACYSAIIQRLKNNLITSISQQDTELTSAIKEALNEFFHYIEANRAAARLVMIEVLGVSDTVDSMYQKAMLEIDNIITQASNPSYQEHDHLWDRQVVSAGLTGAVTQIGRQWILEDYKHTVELMVESCFVLFKAAIDYLEHLSPQD